MDMMTKNAADPKQVRNANKREKAALQRERADLQSVLSSKQGRRFVMGIIEASGLMRLSLVLGQEDNTAFREGRRSLGMGLRDAIISMDLRLYHLMEAEAYELDQLNAQPEQETDHGRDNPDSGTDSDNGN